MQMYPVFTMQPHLVGLRQGLARSSIQSNRPAVGSGRSPAIGGPLGPADLPGRPARKPQPSIELRMTLLVLRRHWLRGDYEGVACPDGMSSANPTASQPGTGRSATSTKLEASRLAFLR